MEEQLRRTIYAGGGLILVTLAIFVAAFLFTSRHVNSRIQAMNEAQTRIDAHARLLKTVEDFRARASEVAGYQAQIDSILPPQKAIIEFPRWITRLGEAHGVQVGFSFGGEPVGSGEGQAGYVLFSIDAEGKHENLEMFFEELELRPTKFIVALETFDASFSGESVRVRSRGRVFFQ